MRTIEREDARFDDPASAGAAYRAAWDRLSAGSGAAAPFVLSGATGARGQTEAENAWLADAVGMRGDGILDGFQVLFL